MRRRRLLAALGTGALAGAAGCGYAYGGGDLRDAGSVGTTGFGETRFVLGDDRIVAARSGRHFWHGDEDSTFDDGTSVTVADRSGEARWRYTHRARSPAVAGTDPVYLLDDRNRVVAISEEPPEDDPAGPRRRPYDGEELWRVTADGSTAPLAADRHGAYVTVDEGIAAVREGEVVWRIEVAGSVESLHPAGDTLLVGTAGAVVAFTTAGGERWRQPTDGAAGVATAGGRVVLRDERRVTMRDLEGGERLWAEEVERPRGGVTMTAGRVYVVAGHDVSVYDADTGDGEWRVTGENGPSTPVVPAPEGAYGVGGGCRALALDENGQRWTRELSVASCAPVGGWLDGETVALLFESGDLRWFQRTDQDTGLL